jgi:hypothetical protein
VLFAENQILGASKLRVEDTSLPTQLTETKLTVLGYHQAGNNDVFFGLSWIR